MIRDALGLSRLKLKFVKGLEEKFNYNYFKSSLIVIRLALISAIVLYAIFGVLDIWLVPVSHNIIWFIRYAVIVPSLSLGLLLSFSKTFIKYYQLFMFIVGTKMGVGIVAMVAVAEKNELGYSYYFPGLMLVIMWIYAFSRMKFYLAAISSWISTICYFLVLIVHQNAFTGNQLEVSVPLFINSIFFFVGVHVIGMFSSFSMEGAMRKNFLLNNKLFGLLGSSKKVLNNSYNLLDSNGKIQSMIKNIEVNLHDINKMISNMTLAVMEMININEEVKVSSSAVKDVILEQEEVLKNSALMEDIISDIQETNKMSKEKIKETKTMLEKSLLASSSIVEIKKKIDANSNKINNVEETYSKIKEITSEISLAFNHIFLESNKVQDIGEQSKENLEILDREIKKISL